MISCFPYTSTVFAQDEWATFVCTSPTSTFSPEGLRIKPRLSFVGNSRLPQWAQTNLVNIYLFQADSGDPVANQTNVTNPSGRAGQVHFQINDTWWGPRGSNWDGQNQSFPFYFLITRNDKSISNTDIPQATFTAVREYRPFSSGFTEF